MSRTSLLLDVRSLILDMDGTLTRGSKPLPGLSNLFAFLHARDIAFTVVTNNTVKTPEHYARKLADFTVEIEVGQVITAAVATADYLRHRLSPASPLFVIGETGLRTALQQAGFMLVDGAEKAVEAVVVGGDRSLTYDKLRIAVHYLLHGAQFIGTNPDLLVPTEYGLAPEAGVTLAALQTATSIIPTIIGKPERPLLDLALAHMQAKPEQTAIVGDRLDTDILGGQHLGLTTILVTTGVDGETAITTKGIQPDHLVHGLDQLVTLWEDIA